MRIALFLATIAALVLAGFFAIAGYFLAHATAGSLKVGALPSTLAATETPTDPLALGYRGNPMQALSLPFQIVPLETPLGPAEAWLVPAEGPEAGRAIYVHGMAGAREDGYRHLSMLHEAGWSVLLISYRNDSSAPLAPEGLHGFGLLEWPDLEAAVKHMDAGPDGPGVLVVADAMGAAILGQFLAQSPVAGRVGAVALDSPSLSLSAILDQTARQGGKAFPGISAKVAGLMLSGLTGLSLDRAEVAATFQAFPGPLFIAHGTGDKLMPIAPSRALAGARPGTAAHWTEAGYLGSYAADPAAYRAAFAAFLGGLGG
jgi:uncharacterized protein